MEMIASPLISVIMPVYNAEKTLRDSAGSVLGQTCRDLELILVDDGSRDGSLALCQALEKQDARVRVISQANAGPACARNTALEAARGAFILFADSDDRLTPDACQMMLDAIGDNELVIAHYYFDLGTLSSPRGLLPGNRSISEDEFLMALLPKPGTFYFSALWNKLYRKEIIESLALRFDPFLTWGEDFAFNMQYYHAIHNGVSLVEQPVYHYIKNPTSTSMRTLLNVVHSCRVKARLYHHFKALYVEKNLYAQHKRTVDRYIWNVTLAD